MIGDKEIDKSDKIDDPTELDSYSPKEIVSRVEDLENNKVVFLSDLVPLTPSSSLEDVKGRLNIIIEAFNA